MYTCIPNFGEAMNPSKYIYLCKEEKERMGKPRGNERKQAVIKIRCCGQRRGGRRRKNKNVIRMTGKR